MMNRGFGEGASKMESGTCVGQVTNWKTGALVGWTANGETGRGVGQKEASAELMTGNQQQKTQSQESLGSRSTGMMCSQGTGSWAAGTQAHWAVRHP